MLSEYSTEIVCRYDLSKNKLERLTFESDGRQKGNKYMEHSGLFVIQSRCLSNFSV